MIAIPDPDPAAVLPDGDDPDDAFDAGDELDDPDLDRLDELAEKMASVGLDPDAAKGLYDALAGNPD